MNNTNKNVNQGKSGVLSVFIGIFSAILIILVVCIIVGLSKGYQKGSVDEKSLRYDISAERYANITESVNRYRYCIKNPSAKYEELMAVTDYNNAALLYFAYSNDQNSVKADFYRKRMDEAESRLGSMSNASSNIDELIISNVR